MQLEEADIKSFTVQEGDVLKEGVQQVLFEYDLQAGEQHASGAAGVLLSPPS
jgi:hypothetical protein